MAVIFRGIDAEVCTPILKQIYSVGVNVNYPLTALQIAYRIYPIEHQSVYYHKQPIEVGAGEARIANTQIAIWELVNAQYLGCSDRDLLQMYLQLTENDLATAWDYTDAHPEEIMLALQAIDE
jgi:uncharacterized protein (DUF433 family)